LIEKPKRVDMYLSALFEEFSRAYVQKIIDRGQVTLNGKTFYKNIKVKNGDEISMEIILEKLEVEAEEMNLDIVFEDKEIIVINKEPQTNVHPVPGEGGNSGTLVNGILHHCKEALPNIGGVERPWIVHRLDKDTTGLIMVAKTDKMMAYLSETIKERQIDKYYIAVVLWKVKNRTFKIESYMGRDKSDRTKMTTIDPVNPKIAITYGEIMDYIDNEYTVLKIKIETGRTHQIRVHLASIGYPILGDRVYGNKRMNTRVNTIYQLGRQALHAYELNLELYGKPITFRAPLKEDMKRLIWDIEIR
jgi:23S rRNA pseudouridine1911/1915/1917 synthase